jgi:hypothetical protein
VNDRQLAALTDPFNPRSLAEAGQHLKNRRSVRQHGDGWWSITVLAVDR